MTNSARLQKTGRSLANVGYFLLGLGIVAITVRIQFDSFYFSMSSLTGEHADPVNQAERATIATALFAGASILAIAVHFEFRFAGSIIPTLTSLPRPTRKKVATFSLLIALLLAAAQIGIILLAWSVESERLAGGALIGRNGYPIELITDGLYQTFVIPLSFIGFAIGLYFMRSAFDRAASHGT